MQSSVRKVLKQIPGLSRARRSIRNTLEVLAESIAPKSISDRYHGNGFFGNYGSGLERDRHEETLAMVARFSESHNWGSALEVGCAEGHFTALLATRCCRVDAIDISELACIRAKSRCARLKNVRIHQRDFTRSSIDGTYDLVFVMDVLEYVRPSKRTSEVANMLVAALRPEGLLVVSDVLESPERDSWIARQLVTAPEARMRPYFQHPQLRLMHQQYHPALSEVRPPYLKHTIAVFARSCAL